MKYNLRRIIEKEEEVKFKERINMILPLMKKMIKKEKNKIHNILVLCLFYKIQ
jgi:hypothetical protein